MPSVTSDALNRPARSPPPRTGRLPLDGDRALALLIFLLIALRLALYAWLAGGVAALPDELCHWDCAWYRGVAQIGYTAAPKTWADGTFGQADWAFFPLYPKLVYVVQRLLHGSFATAATLLSNACLGVFVFLSVRYPRRPDAATNGPALAVFLLAYPFGFYLSIPYTEAIYAALTMAAFWCLAADRLLAASLFGALLSATRVTGVLLAPVIAWRCLAPVWRAWRAGDRAAAGRAFGAALPPLALAPAGLFAFMAYLYVRTGDGLAFYHIQHAWNRPQEAPWLALWQGLLAFDLFSFQPRHGGSLTIDALSGLAALGLSLRLCFARRFAEGWFLASAVLVPLTHGLGSMARYSLAQPLFMVFLFEAMWRWRPRLWFWPVVACGAALQILLVALWMRGYACLY